ncbi:CitMHS family transporter [Psychrobacillus lasiicapitis]|uniref:Citrate transporter n=1 Tax=Psychrobacillus lasiicapitis TaxID=1636719 RepID=A0A544T958_9BACI|nr:citrate:proton symporter [Psychrobacillus lasiicapitis]TQR13908.1 citrate transporter [Psychrobacillus lasiicapitis]GGA36536.1 citrate transporter [Psychrobacillus lasiicapitis]
MLALLGFLTIGVFLLAIFTKKLSVIVSLVIIPIIFGLIGGFGAEIGGLMLDGLIQVAPTGIMLVFAIMYFGLMMDVGLFDPMIKKIIQIVKGDPLKVVMGTVFLAMIVHMDGNGSATFMITVTAMLPIYEKLGMNRLILAGVVALGAGVMNMIPWGGPTARAMTTLNAEAVDIFNPVIPAMVAGIAWVLVASYLIGREERKRLGIIDIEKIDFNLELDEETKKIRRPKLFYFNLLLTLLMLCALLLVWLPMPVVFIVGFIVALMVNYPKNADQQARILSHAGNVLLVASMIFAAGIFTGILNGTGMIGEMASALVRLIPESLGNYLPTIVAITSMPLSLVFTPDAYYFGVLPIISETASNLGINPHEIGRAAILGQMTVGFPLSPLTAATFILIGLTKVDLFEHQKFIFKWAFGTTIVMTIVALLTGAISI